MIVYASYEKEDLAPYKAAFEKDVPGITIRWVHDANGGITARLLAKKPPRANTVWGVAASSLGQLADADVPPPNLAELIMVNDFAWAARNRERISAQWAKRYDGKADPNR